MNIKEYFGDSKILVTGASGFVGRNLFNNLKKQGCNVIGTKFNKDVEGLIQCDLTKFDEVMELMKDVKYIFLNAARTYGAEVLKNNPSAMVVDTVSMNGNVLEAAYRTGIVEKILYVSSSTVYQDAYRTLNEDELDWNKNPFKAYMGVAWVKRYIEKLCEFYSQLGMEIVIVRPTNIYGPYDKYEEGKSHFIPAIIKRALEKQKPFVVWGTGKSVKNVIYIEDFIRDILKVFLQHSSIDAINVCGDGEYSITDIVNVILKETNHITIPIYDPSKPDSIPYRGISRKKLDCLYGKETYTSLDKGIKNTVNWLEKELDEK